MKNPSKSLTGILCVIIAGCFLLAAVNKYKNYDRTVSVRGLCEKEVRADKATYPISFSESGNDLAELNSRVNQHKQTIIQFLNDNGIPSEDIFVSVPSVQDYRDNYYDRPHPNYTMSSTITVSTRKVDEVLQLQSNLSQLVEKGIAINVNSWNTEYEFTGLNEIKPQMIEEATQSAREAASKFAKDSKSKVGKIKEASQGYFTIDNRDENTPYIKSVRVVTTVTYYLR